MKEIRNTETINQSNSESRLVEGYAVVFQKRSIDLGGFYEVIDRSALDGVIEKSDIVCLLDHDIKRGVLARSRNGNGSLKLSVDDKGLYFSFDAPKTALGDEILEGVRRGDISSCSFAFTVDDDEYTKEADGTILRTIRKVNQLYDISLVYKPAYNDTEVDTRGFNDFVNNISNINMEVQKNEEIRNQEEVQNSQEVENRNDEETKDKEEVKEEEKEKEVEEKSEETNPDEKEDKKEEKEEEIKEEEKSGCKSDEKEERNSKEIENKEIRNTNKLNSKHNIMDNKFSLINTINDVIAHRSFNDVSNEVITRSKEIANRSGINFGSDQIVLSNLGIEERAVANPNGILAQEATYGSEAVPTEIFDITGKLRDKMVLSQAGARFVNVSSNLDFVSYSGSTCGWGDEISEAVDGSGKFTLKKLSPRRLCTVLPISKTWLAQADGSAEALLREDLVNAIAETLQKTILGDEQGSDIKPEGLFYNVNQDANSFEYADVVNIEEYLEAKNFNTDNSRWIVSPSAKAIMRNTKVDAGSGRFVYEGNEVLGVPAYSTSSVVDGGVVYGDFSELIIANWNSMSILVDEFTLAAKNQIRLVVNYYVNYILRREDALVKRIIKA